MKNLLKTVVAVTLLSVTFSQPTVAREFADIYTDCGLGAMIAPTNDAVAAVTNVTWDSGTTAISSDASSPDSCKGGKEKTAAFIHDAYEQIESDLAAGQGEYLDNLVTIAGCSATDSSAIIGRFRADFADSLNTVNYAEQTRFDRAKGMFDTFTLRIHEDFAGSCSIS